MSIDTNTNEPDIQNAIDYESFALEISKEMQRYIQIKNKLKEFGLLFNGSYRKGRAKVTLPAKRPFKELGLNINTAKMIVKTVCQMFEFDFEEPEAEDEKYRIIGYVCGFSDQPIRFGWPVELEECIIVTPRQLGSHSEHFLSPLADSNGTLSELFGTYGLVNIVVPESEFSYIEIDQWEKELPFRRRSSIQDQVLAYTNWICWGTQQVDMGIMERLVKAHKAEVTEDA